MSEEILFLIHNVHKLHPNDYANSLYFRIIDRLLLIDENKTIDVIEDIENEEDMELITTFFPGLSGHFQSKKLIEKMQQAVYKFKNSKYYDSMIQEIEDAKNALLF